MSRLSGMSAELTSDIASLADAASAGTEITVPGAKLGDFAFVSFSLDVADLSVTADVTAANTVTVTMNNNTGGAVDLASGTLRVKVVPYENI